jgi:F-type H+-transporting ATPase subunit b
VPSESTEDTVVESAEEGTPLAAASSGEATTEVKTAPNPIAPETKELAWAAGSFLVLFVILRYFLFPKLKKGMDARYADIRSDIEGADQVKLSAQSDVAEYEKALAAARAEASARIDAARQTVDNERTAQLAQVNARIAAARAEADQQTSAARAAAQGEVAAAVAQVASKAAELASGRTPDAATVQAAVAAAMQSAGSR